MVLAGMLMPISIPKIGARDAMDQSLTGQAGNPVRGRAIATDARKGNCIICHAMPIPELSDLTSSGSSLGQCPDAGLR
jgi:L-cysteine S-thiosulfotransferase